MIKLTSGKLKKLFHMHIFLNEARFKQASKQEKNKQAHQILKLLCNSEILEVYPGLRSDRLV